MVYYVKAVIIFMDKGFRSEIIFRNELGWVGDQTTQDEMPEYYVEHVDYLKFNYEIIDNFLHDV